MRSKTTILPFVGLLEERVATIKLVLPDNILSWCSIVGLYVNFKENIHQEIRVQFSQDPTKTRMKTNINGKRI